jgi:hypothetical protein
MTAPNSVAEAGCTLTPSPARGEGSEIAGERSSSFCFSSSSPLSRCGRGAGGEGGLAIGVPESRTVSERPRFHAIVFPYWAAKCLLHAPRLGREQLARRSAAEQVHLPQPIAGVPSSHAGPEQNNGPKTRLLKSSLANPPRQILTGTHAASWLLRAWPGLFTMRFPRGLVLWRPERASPKESACVATV